MNPPPTPAELLAIRVLMDQLDVWVPDPEAKAEEVVSALREAGVQCSVTCTSCKSYRTCDGPDCCGCCPGWVPA